MAPAHLVQLPSHGETGIEGGLWTLAHQADPRAPNVPHLASREFQKPGAMQVNPAPDQPPIRRQVANGAQGQRCLARSRFPDEAEALSFRDAEGDLPDRRQYRLLRAIYDGEIGDLEGVCLTHISGSRQ